MERSRTLIAATDQDAHLDWLNRVVGADCEIIGSDPDSTDRLFQIIEATGAGMVFVSLSSKDVLRRAGLIEHLLERHPRLAIVAVSDEADQRLLLSAMRAGAKDFIEVGLDEAEARDVVERLLERSTSGASTHDSALSCVFSARPDDDGTFFAMHLATALRSHVAGRVLLCDIGQCLGDAALFLGMFPSYTFIDALHSVRRFDETLIETAFSRHESGLYLLALPDDPDEREAVAANDVGMLLGILRGFFDHIVLNIGAHDDFEVVRTVVSRADNTVVLLEPTVPSCRSNRATIDRLREQGVVLRNAGLVVDRCLRRNPTSPEEIAAGLGLPLWATLPTSEASRLRVKNNGASLYALNARDAYLVPVDRLAGQLASGEAIADLKKVKNGGGLFGRVFGARSGKSAQIQ